MQKHTTPEVSVVCAWYNRAKYVRATLDSLLEQNFDSYEVIVVNDGSQDPEVQLILDEYDDPRLKTIYQQNTGFVGAITRAIASASGKYIAIQGSGDISLPDRISTQAKFLDANPGIAVVGCIVSDTIVGGTNDGEKKFSPCPSPQPNLNLLLYGGNPFSHGEVMFRKPAYEAAGGYRSFFKFSQDRDLWLRMASFGGFAVINKHLYDRKLIIDDGVSTNYKKLIIQQALSNFARQSYHDRKDFGCDLVDVFGPDAGLFRRPSKSLSKTIAKFSIKYLLAGNYNYAALFSRLAIMEHKNPTSMMTFLLIRACLRSRLVYMFVSKAITIKKPTTFEQTNS